MTDLPLAVRIAAGLAVVTVERARKLPKDIAELPMTAASQAMQVSMLVQQQITDLAIRGDDAIARLRPVPEQPSWAVFDEDADDEDADGSDNADDVLDALDDGGYRSQATAEPKLPLPSYPQLTLPSLRARLRGIDVDDLQALLDYELANADRPDYVRMLTNRINRLRQAERAERPDRR